HAAVLPVDPQGVGGGRHYRRRRYARHLRAHRAADRRPCTGDAGCAVVHGLVEQLPVAAAHHQRPRPDDFAVGSIDPARDVPGADAVEHRHGRHRPGDSAHHPGVPVRPALGDRGRGRIGSEGVSEPRSVAGAGRAGGSVAVDRAAILAAQLPNGAYPASAGFSQYGHCWLRDGSFIAHAADLAGEHDSAARFHAWVARAVAAQADTVRDLVARRRAGEPITEFEFLPARFSLEGQWQRDGWPNFQLDGYGQWLWSLARHLEMTSQTVVPQHLMAAVTTVVDYLEEFWDEPCYDCWEEFRSQLHTPTLAAISAGMGAIAGPLAGA